MAFITNVIQDCSKSDFDQQVCYFSPTSRECPSGWQQAAFLSQDTARQQRQFCIANIAPGDLSSEALRFWNFGFWEKKGRQKDLASCTPASHKSYAFNLACFSVDHSIPGACAWSIETGRLSVGGHEVKIFKEYRQGRVGCEVDPIFRTG